MTLASVVLTALTLVAAAALVVLTTLLRHGAAELGASVESVRLAEETHLALLGHTRLSNQALLTPSASHAEELQRSEDALVLSLRELMQYATTQEERAAVQDVQRRVAAYFAVREEAVKRTGGEFLKVRQATLQPVEDALAALDALVDLNVLQARTVQRRLDGLDHLANVMGVLVAVSLVLGVLMLLWWFRTWALQPLFQISSAIRAYADGEREARAPIQGPDELRAIATTFNNLASVLEQQNRTRLTFLAGVAHDLRTPLSTVKVALGTLSPQRGPPDETRLQRVISMLTAQVDRMDRQLTDLLDAARVEAGELALRFERRDIREFIAQAVELYRPSSLRHELVLDLGEAPLWVECDPVRIFQVVTNLVSNAIKYSPAGGCVEVRARREGDHVTLWVTDHGVGIPEEEMPRIFEPFRRAAATADGIPGVGLGLSVVRRIVKAHRGRITVSSQVGVGTTFRVELPQAPLASVCPPRPEAPSTSA
ncbi:MAG: HAMP domain-containing sensor histidine kinase [Myxococcota bacterium]